MKCNTIPITLDRGDAERLSDLFGKMHHYIIGAILSTNGECVPKDEVNETELSAFKLFAAMKNALDNE
jgi:hypothetical protein